jgi:hypothetical protein
MNRKEILKRFGPRLVLVGVLLLLLTPPSRSETNDGPAEPGTEEITPHGTTIPQAAPIVNLLSSIKAGDSGSLKSVWSKRMIERINPEGTEEKWEEVLGEYSDTFEHYYGDFELEDFRFSYEGDEMSGKLITDFKEERVGPLKVIKEGGEWKLDER